VEATETSRFAPSSLFYIGFLTGGWILLAFEVVVQARYQNNTQTLQFLGRTVSPRPTIISLFIGYIYSIEIFTFRIYQQL